MNNAGASWGAPLDQFPEVGWDKVMDTNVKGTIALLDAEENEDASAYHGDNSIVYRNARRVNPLKDCTHRIASFEWDRILTANLLPFKQFLGKGDPESPLRAASQYP